jgi:GMP reductase
MRIETELKLDFKDVLIRPKRSTLSSRAEVDISREFRLRNSGRDYHGIPIVAANMDVTGTMAMARALGPHGLSVALHKHYDEDALVAFFADLAEPSSAFYSMGITDADRDKFERVMARADGRIGGCASTWPTATPRPSCASSRRCANGTPGWRSWPATSSPAR